MTIEKHPVETIQVASEWCTGVQLNCTFFHTSVPKTGNARERCENPINTGIAGSTPSPFSGGPGTLRCKEGTQCENAGTLCENVPSLPESLAALTPMQLRSMFPAEARSHRAMLQRLKRRGLAPHPSFAQFRDFLAAAGPMPKPGMTLDRIDNSNPGYFPGGVRWADAARQNSNKSDSIVIYDPGARIYLTSTQIAKRQGISPVTIRTLWHPLDRQRSGGIGRTAGRIRPHAAQADRETAYRQRIHAGPPNERKAVADPRGR